MVRRKNVFLEVAPEAVDSYLAKGYDVVDDYGKVIKPGTINDVNALKAAYDKHVARIKELEDTVRQLETQLRNLRSLAPQKPETPVEIQESKVEAVTDEVETSTKKGKKTKKS